MRFEYTSFMSPSSSFTYDECVGELIANTALVSISKQRILNLIEPGKPDTYYMAIKHIVCSREITGTTMAAYIETINGKFKRG